MTISFREFMKEGKGLSTQQEVKKLLLLLKNKFPNVKFNIPFDFSYDAVTLQILEGDVNIPNVKDGRYIYLGFLKRSVLGKNPSGFKVGRLDKTGDSKADKFLSNVFKVVVASNVMIETIDVTIGKYGKSYKYTG